jgi:hypothetical protein
VPLFADGLKKIRQNLFRIEVGERPKVVKIGVFTEAQLSLINESRAEIDLKPIKGVILFVGRHLYTSRCTEDGYTIEEVIVQIESAFCEDSTVNTNRGTALISSRDRDDGKGHPNIRDEAVFECTQKHPNPELWSIIPRNDGKGYHRK